VFGLARVFLVSPVTAMPDIAVLIGEFVFDAAIAGAEAAADLLTHTPERELQRREVRGDAVDNRLGGADEVQRNQTLAIAATGSAVTEPFHLEFLADPAGEFLVDPVAEFLDVWSDYSEVNNGVYWQLACGYGRFGHYLVLPVAQIIFDP
jgi:hypothetical protein